MLFCACACALTATKHRESSGCRYSNCYILILEQCSESSGGPTGTAGIMLRGRDGTRQDGGGHRPQEIGMTAGHVSTKMRGTTGDG